MTTIVADARHGIMAADRQVTANDGEVPISCPSKIEQVDIGGDQYLVGLAGLEAPGEIFLEWFRDGEWDEPPEPMSHLDEGDSFSALILSRHGIQVVDKFMRPTPIHHRFYAIGSGGIIAWAVIEATDDIDLAMQTAIKMDLHTGFGYTVERLEFR